MNISLDFGDSNSSVDLVIENLNRFGLFPELIQEIFTDDLVEEMAIDWSNGKPFETAINLDATAIEFARKYAEIKNSPICQGMNQRQLEAICDRQLRLQKFKVARWGAEVESYFRTHGAELDRVLLSILQVEDADLAQELFFRIESGEQSFAEIAIDYCQGVHAQNGGILGPVLWGDLDPKIIKVLERLEIGELSPLLQLDDCYTFLRIDELAPASLDDRNYQLLLDRLFTDWLNTQISTKINLISA